MDYDGKCKNLHGHTWKVKVDIMYDSIVAGLSNNFNGLLLDFTIIKNIANNFDHKYLNDIILINPTAENIAALISLVVADYMWYGLEDIIKEDPFEHFTVSVTVWESSTSSIKINNFEALNWLGLNKVESYKKFINMKLWEKNG